MKRPNSYRRTVFAAGLLTLDLLAACGDDGVAATTGTVESSSSSSSSSSSGPGDDVSTEPPTTTEATPTTEVASDDSGTSTVGLDSDSDGTGEPTACEPGSVRACYSGPAGTEGVGVCVGGSQTCDERGAGYGPCVGEVVPGSESCSTPGDEDCDGETLDADAGCVCVPGEVVACYTGPAGTEGVGLCAAGSTTCKPGGTGLNACIGQTLPVAEDCLGLDDKDCDGVVPMCPLAAQWTRGFGEWLDQGAYGLALGPDGGAYVTGSMQGVIDFGSGPLETDDVSDAFLVRFDPAGDALWARRFGDAGEQRGFAVAVDATGASVVAGYLTQAIDLGGGPLVSAGNTDIFLARFDPGGAHLWSQSFGDSLLQDMQAVALTGAGDILITGSFQGAVSFGGEVLVSADNRDLFLARFASDGAHLWSKRFGGASNQLGYGVAARPDGGVVVGGQFVQTLDFGGGPHVSAGGQDVHLASFTADGALQWSRRFGDPENQLLRGLAVDPVSGRVAISGFFRGSPDFGGGPLQAFADDDVFVAMYDAAGAHQWSRKFGSFEDQHARSLAFEPGGGVVVTGEFAGSVNFGGGLMVSGGAYDVFVARFAADGTYVASRGGGDDSDQYGRAIAVDDAGEVYVAGGFAGVLDLGSGPVVSGGLEDVFLARLAP